MNAAIHKYKTVKNIKGEKKEKKTEKKNLLANKVLFNLSITKMVLISFFFFFSYMPVGETRWKNSNDC